MIHPPKTLAEAKRIRYGVWAGNPDGSGSYKETQCAYEIPGYLGAHQCIRKPGHGPKGLYCKQHAKKVEKP